MELINYIPEEIQGLLEDRKRKIASEYDWLIGKSAYLPPNEELIIDAIAVLSLGMNVLLTGPTGSGKTVLAETLSNLFRQPMFSVNCSVDLDAEALLGHKTVSYEGDKQTIEFVPGPVVQSMKDGAFLYIDEINMTNPDTLPILHGMLDHRRRITNPFTSEVITAKPGFNVIAAINEGYIGTTPLNEALKNRFVVIRVPYISGDQLKQVIRRQTKLTDERLIDMFVRLSADLGEAVRQGKLDEDAASIRSLLYACNLSTVISPERAVMRAIVDKLTEDRERDFVMNIMETY
ncbi:MAG: AAA family ATPase [Bacillus sp. (in: firmicutes)]